jgi:hypothetical protein
LIARVNPQNLDRMIRWLLLLSILVLTPALASAQPRPTAEEQQRLDWALQRGRLLFEIDRAAWVTTDDLVGRVGDLGRAGVRGWTVEREGDGYSVIYFAGDGDARAALYRARVDNNRIVSSQIFAEGARPQLTPVQRRIADVRATLDRIELRTCARSGLNIAVIPPDSPDAPMDFYVLTPQTRAGSYPAGGHNRVTLSASGEVLSHRAFTNSCLELTEPQGQQGRAAALAVTHLLEPIPTEIHVFLAIWIGLPVYVAAGERLWEVTGRTIRLVDNLRQAPRT